MLAGMGLALGTELGGTYEVADPPEVVAAEAERAVERSAAAIPWLPRLFARPVLRRAVWTCGELEVRLAPDEVWVRCDDKQPLVVPLDGRWVPGTAPGGDPYEVSASAEGSRVALHFKSALGERFTEMDLDPEGGLRCVRRVVSPQLPVPLEWEVRYRER